MSLSGSLQIASNSLRAVQIGLQVVGQNIANANTPGYIREDVNFGPAPTQQIAGLNLGLGVQVNGIIQNIDSLLEQRLRTATSESASATTQQQTFQQLEMLTSELGDTGLGKSLSNFVSSINDVLNQPDSSTVRNLAVLSGQTLAADIGRLNSRADEIRSDLNKQIDASVSDLNRLTKSIADLNSQISRAEGGNGLKSPAVGLRDQRNVALGNLAQLVNINVQDRDDGTVAVYVGGDFLVFGNEARQIQLSQDGQGSLQLSGNNSQLQSESGKLVGLVTSRDEIIGGYQSKLDNFAKNLAFEFNKLHSSGQGLNGYQQVTSQEAILDADKPLDAAGLSSTPVNGSFQLQVYDKTTKLTRTTDITVDLNGLDHDTSLNDLVAQANAIQGVSAAIDSTGHLTIKSSSPDQDIAFGNDSSGVLAALGINTFFTGNTARTLAVNQALLSDPSKFAASSGGIGAYTGNAIELASFLERPVETENNNTLTQLHDNINTDITLGAAQAISVSDGLRTFESSLKGQSLSISGVNVDEEAIKLLTFQRSFQASARFISTINDLLGVLMDL